MQFQMKNKLKKEVMKSRFSPFCMLVCVVSVACLLGCSKLEERIEEVSSRVDDIENSQDNSEIEALTSRIQSISFIPEYSDGKASMSYTSSYGSITPGSTILKFEIQPAHLAASLAEVWDEALSLKAVYAATRATAVESFSIPITDVTASEDGILTVTASGSQMDLEFFRSGLSANVRLLVSSGSTLKCSEYFNLIPWMTGWISVPDANFKNYLIYNFDTDGDGEISKEEALAVREIDIAASLLTIRSLSGIENFTNIEKLNCSSNCITSLCLGALTNLKELDCSRNRIASLDLSSLTKLEELDCSYNLLTSLGFRNMTSLKKLNASNNLIEIIDLEGCTGLTSLDCSKNELFIVKNIEDCTGLKILDVSGNSEIYHISFRLKNYKIQELNVSGLGISELDLLSLLELKKLDLTDNANLTRVICPSQNWLCGVAVKNDALKVNLYEDFEGTRLYGGSMIDGKFWTELDYGCTSDNLLGSSVGFDAAQNACPNGWRLPTKEEMESLSKNYSPVVTVSGQQGRWFSGSTAYSDTVPAVFFLCNTLSFSGYWTSTPDNNSMHAFGLRVDSDVSIYYIPRTSLCAVRCIKN